MAPGTKSNSLLRSHSVLAFLALSVVELLLQPLNTTATPQLLLLEVGTAVVVEMATGKLLGWKKKE